MWRSFRYGGKKKASDNSNNLKDMLDLYNEILVAKRDWDNALRHFEYALGKDQIDYAIFAIEAAEKRYEMLLRKAKVLQGDSSQWSSMINCRLRGDVV
ncbi:hypothetical protein Back11_44990 [Paenibacillus baekrokdamisoli]|uniref:Uncharacterized protein n=1 Tax=Paenibacillus baekrokdamisoli TaxID=1712516 RepID=A0A3G9JJJ8_9BACL|nr:DUF2508 family protein [Paenibacillus baekrokdamisoli]MBB3072282.1 hypothetical protein [Paenibacillus baekrokdamisoli]BBH23154.1 hypothetical protein Back11_44990 [Paenibacillus baekrokdamisoli]